MNKEGNLVNPTLKFLNVLIALRINQTQVASVPSAIGNPSQNLNQGDLLNSQALAEAYDRAGVEK